MKTRILSLTMALAVCLGLMVPAAAAFPETWEEAKTCYTFERQGAEAAVSDGLAVKLPVPLDLPDNSINGYNLASKNTTWKLENVNPAEDIFLCVAFNKYGKDTDGQYMLDWFGELYDDGRLWGIGQVDVVENPIQIAKLGPGESMVFGMSSLLDCEMFYDGQIDPDAVYELTICVMDVNADPETGLYWYTNYYYKLDDAAVAAALSGGSATTPPAANTVGGFSDVKEGDYCADPVLWAVDKGVTTGTGDGSTFSPANTCSVSEILTFLWRAKNAPAPTIANPYTAGSADGWFQDAAVWAYENGLTADGAFPAGEPCTRSMVVTYLWKLAGSPAAAGSDFSDVSADASYAQAVAWAVSEGITTGTGDGTAFSPDKTCTRGEIVTFLYRALAE